MLWWTKTPLNKLLRPKWTMSLWSASKRVNLRPTCPFKRFMAKRKPLKISRRKFQGPIALEVLIALWGAGLWVILPYAPPVMEWVEHGIAEIVSTRVPGATIVTEPPHWPGLSPGQGRDEVKTDQSVCDWPVCISRSGPVIISLVGAQSCPGQPSYCEAGRLTRLTLNTTPGLNSTVQNNTPL